MILIKQFVGCNMITMRYLQFTQKQKGSTSTVPVKKNTALFFRRVSGANRVNNANKQLLKQWCNACEREYGEKWCKFCPLWGFCKGVEKHYTDAWTMAQAFRWFMRLSPTPKQAKKIVEETINMPLHIAQMILREIKDYEEHKDCHDV